MKLKLWIREKDCSNNNKYIYALNLHSPVVLHAESDNLEKHPT